VRPLMQAYAAIIPPAEGELNRVWHAQVYEPFQRTLAGKYPFSRDARIEATPADIAKIFGPEGAIAKFSEQTLGPLVTRRGDTLTPRTWADMGVRLRPEFTLQFASWVAPLAGASAPAGSTAAAEPQTVFQLLPQPAPGLTEYTVEIDGQLMRYRNTAASWTHFVWPAAQGTPGVRITGVRFDGRTVEFINFPGRFGLEKMVHSAEKRKLPNGLHELRWTQGDLSVAVQLRIISTPASSPAAPTHHTASGAALRGAVLPSVIAGDPPAAPAASRPASSIVSTAS